MKDVAIALDIGGTSMKGAVIDIDGNVIYKESFDTIATHTTEEHRKYITNVVERLITTIDKTKYKLVGFGVDSPGVSNSDTLHIGGAENIPGIKGLKFSDIGDKFSIKTRHANDASVAALGEYKFGKIKNKDYKSMMFITLGTGVGGGLVLNGKLFVGARGAAGEIGHASIVPNGIPCNCGSHGCIEKYASATAFVDLAKQKIHKALLKTTLTYEKLEKNKAKAVFDEAKTGDELSKEVVRECSYALGISISQGVNLLDLDLVLIGGGLSKDFDMMENDIWRGVRDYSLRLSAGDLVIKAASLGNDAGILGCAALIFE